MSYVFTPDESVGDLEVVQKALDALPMVVLPKVQVGKFNNVPAVLIPFGFSVDMENLKKSVPESVFVETPDGLVWVLAKISIPMEANVQATRKQGQTVTIRVPQGKPSRTGYFSSDLAPFIPDWIRPFMGRYGTSNSESMSKDEREAFARLVWDELSQRWHILVGLLKDSKSKYLPTNAIALIYKFPSEFLGSKKRKVKDQTKESVLVEETKRNVLSDIFNRIRQFWLEPFINEVAPIPYLDLRILEPMPDDELRDALEGIHEINKLYRDAYLVYTFVRSFTSIPEDEPRIKVVELDVNALHEVPKEKLVYLEPLVKAYEHLLETVGVGYSLVDRYGQLIAPSKKWLKEKGVLTTTAIVLDKLDLLEADEKKLREIEDTLKFIMNSYNSKYGVEVVETKINPSSLVYDAFSKIVALLGICENQDDACVFNAMEKLVELPSDLRETFIENLVATLGKEKKYRILYINMFASLFALLRYYEYVKELEMKKLEGIGKQIVKKEKEKLRELEEKAKFGLYKL